MERTDLITGLDLERLGPTAEISSAPGQTGSKEKRGKARRRSASSEDELGDLEADTAPHQLDRLA
jgi:hypothetical protein